MCAKRGLRACAWPSGRWGVAGPVGWVLGLPPGSEPTPAARWEVTGPPGQGLASSLVSGSADLVGSLKGGLFPVPPCPHTGPAERFSSGGGPAAAFGVQFLQGHYMSPRGILFLKPSLPSSDKFIPNNRCFFSSGIHSHTHVHTHTLIHTHLHNTHTNILSHTQHTHIHTHTQTCMHTYSHTHTCMHTHTTYIHTHAVTDKTSLLCGVLC